MASLRCRRATTRTLRPPRDPARHPRAGRDAGLDAPSQGLARRCWRTGRARRRRPDAAAAVRARLGSREECSSRPMTTRRSSRARERSGSSCSPTNRRSTQASAGRRRRLVAGMAVVAHQATRRMVGVQSELYPSMANAVRSEQRDARRWLRTSRYHRRRAHVGDRRGVGQRRRGVSEERIEDTINLLLDI